MSLTLREFAERNMPYPCDIVYSRGTEAHYIDGDEIMGGCSYDGGEFKFWEGDVLDCADYDYVMNLARFE